MIEYWLVSLAVLGACQIITEALTINSGYQCSKQYNLGIVESVDIKLEGGWSGTQSCEIMFENNESHDFKTCVKPVSYYIDCTTVIEYQEHFVSDYIDDGNLTCDQSSFEEHCVSFVSKFYVVFKKLGHDDEFKSYENAHLRVYRQEDGSNSKFIALMVAIPIVLVCLVTLIICCKIRQNRRGQPSLSQVNYNTHVGTTAPTAVPYVPPQQPLLQQYRYPPQQPMAPCTQSMDGYTIHPTVTAYPANQPVSYQPVPPQQQQQQQQYVAPSAPQMDMNAPPPSYASIIQK